MISNTVIVVALAVAASAQMFAGIGVQPMKNYDVDKALAGECQKSWPSRDVPLDNNADLCQKNKEDVASTCCVTGDSTYRFNVDVHPSSLSCCPIANGTCCANGQYCCLNDQACASNSAGFFCVPLPPTTTAPAPTAAPTIPVGQTTYQPQQVQKVGLVN